MRYFLLLIPLLNLNILFAQESSACDTVYKYVEEEPRFIDGQYEMTKWLITNISYPKKGIDVANGRLYLRLLIDKDGFIRSVLIENSNSWSDLDISGLKESKHRFSPGRIAGIPVCTEMLIPICILLD